MTRKQVEKNYYNPYKTFFKASKKRVVNTPTRTPKPAKPTKPAATTEPTEAPVATQEPTPAPTETPVVQRIMIPYNEHNYTCAGCNPLNPSLVRHTSKTNPYITNIKATYKD